MDPMTITSSPKAIRPLHRSTSDKMVAGVSGGLSEHFNVDPVLFRVGWVVGTLFSAGLGLVAYALLWAVVPRDDGSAAAAAAAPGPMAA